MTLRHWLLSLCMLTGATVLVTVTTAQDVPAPPLPNVPGTKPLEQEKGIQVENRGPVHEAFANPGAPVRGKEGVFADKAPPPPVPELPPEEKPSGDNVQWISGYWQWDLEKKDFVWVSGFWRNTPPGRAWSPGEWRVENGQNRYIPGFWKLSNENSRRIDLPEPPKSVENGPNVPAPHKDAIWIGGHWVHRNSNYAWQPGYWGEVEPNMMWTPPQYNYTGSGYCYVPGYWDYNLEDRGLLYAPVYFTQPLWLNAGWRFSPRFGISVGFGGGWAWGYGGFYDSLFFGPGYGSFWFGGFYGSWGWGAGFRPWCWGGGNGFCSHLYNHYCWLNKGNPNWHTGMQARFAARSAGVIPGGGQHFAGNNIAGNTSHLNPNSIHSAQNLVSKVGGEKMGQQFADRVARGQAIQQANNTLKQTSSMNVVQPASQVLKNQALAQHLPSPASTGTATSSGKSNEFSAGLRSAALNGGGTSNVKSNQDSTHSFSSRPGYAGNSHDAALRNNIDNAIRQAPSGSFSRADSGRVLPSGSMSGSTHSFSGNHETSSRSEISGSSFQGSRSFDGGSRSFNSTGSSSMGSRGSVGGSSMGGSRGSFGGGGGGSHGGGGGGSHGGGGGGKH